MSKKTAVEWLEEKIAKKDCGDLPMYIYNLIEQAKEMEKDQICWAYFDGQHKDKNEIPSKYYHETYKNNNKND